MTAARSNASQAKTPRVKTSRAQTPREKGALKGRSIYAILFAIVGALTAFEFFFAPHYRPVFPWHFVPGHMAAIGLTACLALTGFAKLLGKALQRPEGRNEDA